MQTCKSLPIPTNNTVDNSQSRPKRSKQRPNPVQHPPPRKTPASQHLFPPPSSCAAFIDAIDNMSTLRQVKPVDPPSEEGSPLMEVEDVEAPAESGPSSPKPAAEAFSAASSSDTFTPPPGKAHDPVFLAKVILRKVVGLVATDEGEDRVGVISLLRDLVLGVILGVVTIMVLIFLDHRDVIHLQSAHNFRESAFQILNDPETLAHVEEASNLKFIKIDEYERMKKEIERAPQKITESEAKLAEKTKEWEERKVELDSLRGDHNKLKNSPVLGLNKFCPNCIWGRNVSCAARVKYLQDTYKTKPLEAKMSAMGHASCKKK
ncbi:hypothetical protein ACHAWF_004694 [Thalassiosira exigua]